MTKKQGQGCSFLLIPPAVAISMMLVFGLGIQSLQTPATPLPATTSGNIASFFTPEVRRWEPEIISWSAAFGLDPNLVATVMQIESCGDPQAVSSAGASGLFQVMPYHFSAGEDRFDPQTNARRGLDYLRRAWEKSGGNPRLTLAAYNGGLGVLMQPEESWPDETRRYVYWGEQIYTDARANRNHSPRLEEWLSSGGASLCKQAAQRQP